MAAAQHASDWDRDAALTTARILLEIKAVNFRPEEPYTFTSGWKSPVYIDCRKIIYFPRARNRICDLGVEKIGRHVGYETIDVVAGGETAGIPFAAWIADRMLTPMAYVRKQPKGFGRGAQIEGEVKKPMTIDIDRLTKLAPLEERIYRLRCVEGWSMVIPWIGYPLAALLKAVEPTSRGKFVEFTTLADPRQMPGVASSVLDWPYVEGLRIDEAQHALTLLTFGLYGEVLPKQNGAPVVATQ